ncbi:MAG TPA: methylmalonyl-CoA mutase family protein [Planctomycetota bacterium]|nr:methylmalonyl-CoA mutase family protein [Planctomycetota bacterium]
MADEGARPKGRRWSDRLVAKVKKLESDLDAERAKRKSAESKPAAPRRAARRGASADPLADARRRWEQGFESAPEGKSDRPKPITVSLRPTPPLVDPVDAAGRDVLAEIGWPGEFPYTRGIHRSGYRSKLWTMRQFAGFGTSRDTNERYKFLLAHGQTGLSVAFDLPTLMGYDSDHEQSEGEVGMCGVAISSIEDMHQLFDGIPLDEVSTSMTINGPAAVMLALYVAVAEERGIRPEALRGTLQNDILKEFIAQKEFIFPPRPSLKLVVDTIEYGVKRMPQWNTISISGYHIREAGATAAQELAFTISDGFAYVDAAIERGIPVDAFAPRLSFFWNAHLDFFEEIAKYRAARRIWARHMRRRYRAENPRSWLMRFHTQTAGVSLTAQQPENNIVRTAIEALAAVLGGTQSLHTNSMDETLALPTERSVKIALRTQQVLGYEHGVADCQDPLGGSYYVEKLTDDMDREAEETFRRINDQGGVVPCIESGYQQREIARSAYEYQRALERGDRVVVGVNRFVEGGEKIEIPLLKIGKGAEREQRKRLKALRAKRDAGAVRKALDRVRRGAEADENLMPILVAAMRARATLGEVVEVLKGVYGVYEETPEF